MTVLVSTYTDIVVYETTQVMTTQPSTINVDQLRVIGSRATDRCIFGPDENTLHCWGKERSHNTVLQGLLIGDIHLNRPIRHCTPPGEQAHKLAVAACDRRQKGEHHQNDL